MSLQMAVIKEVEFGVRDTSKAMLSFTAYISESEAALQCIPAGKAIELIERHGITDIKYLNGKTCWVEVGDGLIKFHDLCKL